MAESERGRENPAHTHTAAVGAEFVAVKQRLSQRTPTTQPARTDYVHVEPYNVAYTN